MGFTLDTLEIIEYQTEIIDLVEQAQILILSSWKSLEGDWLSSIPVSYREVQVSNFDVIGSHLRALEDRIRHRYRGVIVTNKAIKLPESWTSWKGPDWLLATKVKSRVATRKSEHEERPEELAVV